MRVCICVCWSCWLRWYDTFTQLLGSFQNSTWSVVTAFIHVPPYRDFLCPTIACRGTYHSKIMRQFASRPQKWRADQSGPIQTLSTFSFGKLVETEYDLRRFCLLWIKNFILFYPCKLLVMQKWTFSRPVTRTFYGGGFVSIGVGTFLEGVWGRKSPRCWRFF